MADNAHAISYISEFNNVTHTKSLRGIFYFSLRQ